MIAGCTKVILQEADGFERYLGKNQSNSCFWNMGGEGDGDIKICSFLDRDEYRCH